MLSIVGRPPTREELTILTATLLRYQDRYAESEALALVCSTIFNLDEAVTSQ